MTRRTPTPQTQAQLDRIRTLLPDRPIREVPMFGTVAVMVDDAMAVAVHRDGSLLVRVDPDQDAQLIQRPHASRPEMGAGRSMGVGWIRVEASGIDEDQALSDWVGHAVRYLSLRADGQGRPSSPSRTPSVTGAANRSTGSDDVAEQVPRPT